MRVLLLLVFVLAGCGGGGVNPYAGSWEGRWGNWPARMVVGRGGDVEGDVSGVRLSGRIGSDGWARLTLGTHAHEGDLRGMTGVLRPGRIFVTFQLGVRD